MPSCSGKDAIFLFKTFIAQRLDNLHWPQSLYLYSYKIVSKCLKALSDKSAQGLPYLQIVYILFLGGGGTMGFELRASYLLELLDCECSEAHSGHVCTECVLTFFLPYP
jgi:hypothetical protein